MIASRAPQRGPVIALWWLMLAVGGVASCATARSAPSAALRITTNAPEATVWIDDRLAGKVTDFASGTKRVPVGFHRLEVRAPGYYSNFREVEVHEGTDVAVTVKADLHAVLE